MPSDRDPLPATGSPLHLRRPFEVYASFRSFIYYAYPYMRTTPNSPVALRTPDHYLHFEYFYPNLQFRYCTPAFKLFSIRTAACVRRPSSSFNISTLLMDPCVTSDPARRFPSSPKIVGPGPGVSWRTRSSNSDAEPRSSWSSLEGFLPLRHAWARFVTPIGVPRPARHQSTQLGTHATRHKASASQTGTPKVRTQCIHLKA